MSYSIISYCSENYADAYQFVIHSWLRNSKASEIIIYTDTDQIKSVDPRVKIVKIPKDKIEADTPKNKLSII